MREHGHTGCARLAVRLPIYFFLCVCLASSAQIGGAQEAKRVMTFLPPPDRALKRTLRASETHSYKIKLRRGDYFHVDVDQRGVDVRLVLIGANDKVIIERDRPNDTQGTESLSFIAATGGEYRLDVKAPQEQVETGVYQIKRDARRVPTARDKKRVAAETAFQEGLGLSELEAAESVKRACGKYEMAVGLWRELGDKYAEALALTSLGYCRARLDEVNQAIDAGSLEEADAGVVAHERALKLYEELQDKPNVAASLMALCGLNAALARADLAIEQCRQAKAHYKELADTDGEARLNAQLRKAAEEYYDLGDSFFARGKEMSSREALRIYSVALQMFKVLEDEANEALALLSIGKVYNSLGKQREALEHYKLSLPMWQKVGNASGEAMALNNIGFMYSELGDKRTALSYYDRSLPLYSALKDASGEATAFNNIGLMYFELGDKQNALRHYKQALPLRIKARDRSGEAITLDNIGLVYDSLGEKQKALDYYGQGLSIWQEIKDESGEARNLNNTGFLYNSLGERQRALDYYNLALPLLKAAGDRHGEAKVLNNIGGVYDSLGDKQKALDYYNQALNLWREAEDRSGEATTLNNLGLVYHSLGQQQKALDHYRQALPLRRAVGDKAGEATTLNNIGGVYDSLRDTRSALDYYNRAVPIWKALGDRSGEATTLGNLMFAWNSLGNPRLAILCGKQSVNAFQQLRGRAQELKEQETQRAFLRSVEDTYRELARLLVEQGRLAEAQQVLNSFKDQQYFDFNPETLKRPSPLAMTARETELSSRYEAAGGAVGAIANRLAELELVVGDRTPKAEGSEKLRQLRADLEAATGQFLAIVKRAEAELAARHDLVKDRLPDVADTSEMQAALRSLNEQTGQKATVIYTSVGKDSFLALIVTHESLIPVISAVKGERLGELTKKFLAQLSQADGRPPAPKFSDEEVRKTGKELYDLVFAPIAAKLKESRVEPDVLMWSLDGSLRYVPVAALHDGKKYLAECYRNVVFTRAEAKRMRSPASRSWTGSGFYNATEYTVAVLGKMEVFHRLWNARAELEAIFGGHPGRGIIAGEFLPDGRFTKDSLRENLRLRHPLVHIASHFRLIAGDADSSFLLLGDGNKLTLAEIKKEPEDLFGGVELLTLSACETGAQKERESDGREIDSFAELAQRKGAQAVLASLWNVDDVSTSRLMVEFYRKRQLKNLTKAEALQKAQLALLKDERYAHPFYWSSFILTGNWR